MACVSVCHRGPRAWPGDSVSVCSGAADGNWETKRFEKLLDCCDFAPQFFRSTCSSRWLIMWPPACDIKQPSDVTPGQTLSLRSLLECDLFCAVSVPPIIYVLSPPSCPHSPRLQWSSRCSCLTHRQRREAETSLSASQKHTSACKACTAHTQRLKSYLHLV